jgi:antigen flippase
MNTVLKATLILGSSSLVSVGLGLLTTVFWAVLLGPEGMGYLGLLQSFVLLGGLVISLGSGNAVIRFGAMAFAQADHARYQAVRLAGWGLGALGSAGLLVLLAVLGGPICSWMIGPAEPRATLYWLWAVITLNLAYAILTGLLNAQQQVKTLAKISLFTRLLVALASIAAISWWLQAGIIPSLVAGGIGSWLVPWFYYRHANQSQRVPVPAPQLRAAAGDLLRFGLPCAASQLVGTGVQWIIPSLVLQMLDQASVGFFRPAMMVSTMCLGMVLTAMAQDYFPRLSAVHQDAAAMVRLVNEQNYLALLLGLPMIALVLGLGPILIPLLLTRKFAPVMTILQWQMMGDVLKFSSWALGFVLLARNRSVQYFVVEAIGGMVLLATTCLGLRFFKLEGLGLAYLASYLVYFLAVWWVCRKEIQMVWTSANRRLILLALGTVLLLRGAEWISHFWWRTTFKMAVAGLVTGLCAWLLNKKYALAGWIRHRLATVKS